MKNTKKEINHMLMLFGITVTIILAALSGTKITTTANMNIERQPQTMPPTSIAATTTTATGYSGAVKVQAGGGNSTNVLIQFIPQQAEIKVGQSVSWYNPTPVGEPHTVTFALDNKTMTNVVGPFAVPNSTQFTPIPHGSNNEPVMVPGKGNVVIAFNARSFSPTVIDSQGNVKGFAPNAAYAMTGSEKYINSGWLLPKGQEQGFPGSSNTFTVTFQKAGIYNYICEVHPWMLGSVIVK
jgi:plastocyanin